MDLRVQTEGDVKVVLLKEEFLDASNTKEFKDQMTVLLGTTHKVVLDLEEVQFMDSSGLSALLTCLKQLTTSGGDLKICGVTNPVRALFDLVRMSRILDIFKARQEAVEAFGA